VWDYPRPPRIEPCSKPVRVVFQGETIASSQQALRVLETSSPPTIYVPPDDVRSDLMREVANHQTYCEWKGAASYFDVVLPRAVAERACWSYPDPKPAFVTIKDYLSFYPGRVECYLGAERVRPQEGGFYGGWITDEIVGPFKGSPGTSGW
jgi:uncharacterized protein (DUF427 family)